jgi:WD repeat-containing protein 53
LAAADDSGEITLLDLSSSSSSSSSSSLSSKILRRVHNNICSTVAFRSHRPWEVMSGGLDAMMVRWDFSRLKTVKKWNIATEATIAANGASSEQQQFINPPMVHCITTPYGDDVEDGGIAKLVVVARGDGCVAVYDGDGRGRGNSGGGQQRGGQRTKKKGGKNKDEEDKVDGPLAVLRSDNGGHTSSANCVEFVHGCGWQRVVSGGNDGRCVVWKWEREMPCNEEEETCSKENGGFEVNKGRKINCVCSSDNVGGYNLFIGDVDGNILAKTV